MLKIIFESFMYVMALYGFVTVIGNLIDSLSRRVKMDKASYQLVISVKNQEQTIEGIIRGIFEDELFRNKDSNVKVVVIDKGSTDETIKILKKLQKDYENLEVIEDLERPG